MTATSDLDWAATTFYDGQGMLVNADSGFTEVADMDGTVICVQTGTTTEINLDLYFSKLGITYEPLNVADEAAVTENFSAGSCDGYTTDKSGLASFKATFDGDVTILDDSMSKEPLGPAVREGDEDFFDVVNWTVFATFNAEEFGLTSENIGSYDGDDGAILKFINDDGVRSRIPVARLDGPGHRSGRQLPGDLRPQHHTAGHPRGAEPALHRGRHPLRTADQLISSSELNS